MQFARVISFSLTILGGVGVAIAQAPEPGNVPEVQPAASAPAGTAQAQPARVVRISSGVVAGLKVSGDVPVYPPDAKAQGVQGAVVLHAVIGEDGHVQSLAVVSGNSMLADAAVDAVKTWVYKPYLLNGEPTAVDTTITVNFNLAP